MIKKLVPVFMGFVLIYCCDKPLENELPKLRTNENGVVIEQPYLWKTPLTDGSYIGTFIDPFFEWKDRLLMGAEKNNSSELAIVDINTGELVMQKPFVNNDLVSISGGYQYEKTAILDGVSTSIIAISLETDEELWSLPRKSGFRASSTTGFEDIYFMCGPSNLNPKTYEIDAVWYGDISSGNATELYYPDLGDEADTCYNVRNYNSAGGIEKVVPYKNLEEELLLLIYYRSYIHGPGGEDFFSLYNFSKKEFIYQDRKLNSGNDGQVHVKNNKIYFTLWEGVFCYDLFTGEEIWEVPLNYRTSWGGFIYDDKLFAVEDELNTANSYLFCIDINTGKMIWRVPSKQCSASIRYLNGVVYFVASEDHKLHAYDAETGKQLWHIESPDFKYDEGAFFKPECSVVPGKNGEKGKVIVSSYFNAFCYEAIR